ncbi:MAG: prolyl oligopeptidase family serine peptidase [Pseudomonadota bacterium]
MIEYGIDMRGRPLRIVSTSVYVSFQKQILVVLSTLVFSLNSTVVAAGENPGKISVEAFAALPATQEVALSPGGRKLALLTTSIESHNAVTLLVIYDVVRSTVKTLLTSGNEKYVPIGVQWENERELLLGVGYPETRGTTRTYETRMLVLDVESGESRPAFNRKYLKRNRVVPPQFQNSIVDPLRGLDGRVLVSLADRDPQLRRVVELNTQTGYGAIVQPPIRGALRWWTDRQHNVRLVLKKTRGGFALQHKPSGEGARWQQISEFRTIAAAPFYPLGFDEHPDTLFVFGEHDGKKAVFKMNTASFPELESELFYALERRDIDGTLIYSHALNRVVGLNESNPPVTRFWDPDFQLLKKAVDEQFPDRDNSFLGFSNDGASCLLFSTNQTDPGSYYYGEEECTVFQRIARRYDDLPERLMAPSQSVHLKVEDGFEFEASLTLPLGRSGPYPMIVIPESSIFARTERGFNHTTQFFASRGYAVMQVPYRRTSRQEAVESSRPVGALSPKMHDDVVTATEWATSHGMADPDRICLYGKDIGGFAALTQVVLYPKLYKCVMTYAAVTDLKSLVSWYGQYTNYREISDLLSLESNAKQGASPVERAADFRTGVLLVHGDRDRIIDVSQSRRLSKALAKAGKDAALIELKNGSHNLSYEPNRVELMRAAETFFEHYLSPDPWVEKREVTSAQ